MVAKNFHLWLPFGISVSHLSIVRSTKLSYEANEDSELGSIFKDCGCFWQKGREMIKSWFTRVCSFYYHHERQFLFLILVFFLIVGYFTLNQLTAGRGAGSLRFSLEDKIPFVSWFIIIYLSAYVAWIMPFLFVKEIEKLRLITIIIFGVMLVSFSVFAAYPIQMIRPEINISNVFDKMVVLIYKIDAPVNTFPSLHVALALFSSLVVLKENKTAGRWLLVWMVLISISTLLIKQHYLLDVLGGALLGMAGLWFYRRSVFVGEKP